MGLPLKKLAEKTARCVFGIECEDEGEESSSTEVITNGPFVSSKTTEKKVGINLSTDGNNQSSTDGENKDGNNQSSTDDKNANGDDKNDKGDNKGDSSTTTLNATSSTVAGKASSKSSKSVIRSDSGVEFSEGKGHYFIIFMLLLLGAAFSIDGKPEK